MKATIRPQNSSASTRAPGTEALVVGLTNGERRKNFTGKDGSGGCRYLFLGTWQTTFSRQEKLFEKIPLSPKTGNQHSKQYKHAAKNAGLMFGARRC